MKNDKWRILNKNFCSSFVIRHSSFQTGFTVIETIVGIAIFSIVSVSMYLAYSGVLDIINAGNFNSGALAVIESEVEIVRTMKYEDVGVQGGAPSGALLPEKTVTLDNVSFTLRTTVRSIDDPFDGTIGGSPNDLAPADYKLVEIEATCTGCEKFLPTRMTTTISPKGLESATNNGALFVNVVNASGQPVSAANVSVLNTAVNPNISINDTTAVNGQLQLVDIATSSGGYRITISKTGYSADQTYAPGSPPNPLQPHATVAGQQLTIVTFAIDRTSTLNFKAQDQFCAPIQAVDYLQKGAKLTGTSPDTPKYSVQHATDSAGSKNISTLEWDTYTFTNLDTDYDIAGTTVPVSLVVDPNQTYAATWTMASKSPMALLITAKSASGQSLADATVEISKTGFSQSKLTGRRTVAQTDWSAGKFTQKSANIEVGSPTGEIHLLDLGSGYASNSQEWLTSQTIDLGSSNNALHTLSWNPSSQPPGAGSDSLRIQLAANNDNATWTFTGPDGTQNTFYTVTDSAIHSSLNNNRYLRYHVYIQTADEAVTPSLQDITITYSSSCFPNDQAYFTGLTSGTYTVTVTKTGYQQFTDPSVSVTGNWQSYSATLTPQ